MVDTALLIPHFNNVKGLSDSISSIGKEEQLDIIIVDDGSERDKIDEQLLNKMFKGNGTIVYLYLEKNKGIEHALNHGLEYILSKNYKFTARLDAGDLCAADRFYKQRNFLEQNSEIKLLGSNVKAQSVNGVHLYTIEFPQNHAQIKNKMYLNAMFIHPAVMFVNDIFNEIGHYPTNYQAAEDYALFFRIVKKFKTANLAETLVTIEINEKGITKTKRKIQVSNRIRIIKENFYFGFWPVYGLVRNYLLFLIPNTIIEKIKILIK